MASRPSLDDDAGVGDAAGGDPADFDPTSIGGGGGEVF